MKNFTLNPEIDHTSTSHGNLDNINSDLGEKAKEEHIQGILTNFLSSLPDITKNSLIISADESDNIKSKAQVSVRNESMISANIQNQTKILDDVAMIEELLKQAEEQNIIEKVDTNDVGASFDDIIVENETIGHGFGDSPTNSLETIETVTETDTDHFTKPSINDETVKNLTKTAIEHIANETNFDKSIENLTKSNVKKYITNTITNINETSLHSNNTEPDDADNSLRFMYNFHFILLCILLIFILIVIVRMFPTILQKLKKRLTWRSVNFNSPVKSLRIKDVNLQSMSPWNGAAYEVQVDNNSPTDTNTEFSFVGSHATSGRLANTSHDSSMRYISRSHDSSMTYVNRVYQHDNDLDRTIEYEMSPENLI